jgi:hypothetical protein
MPRFAWVLLCLSASACGEDERLVVERYSTDAAVEETEQDTDFDLAESRSLEELRDPETRRALCTLLGISAGAQTGAGTLGCQAFVAACEQASQPLGGEAPGLLPVVSDDLSGLLDCPATVTQVDGCVADLLIIARENLGEVTCEATDVNVPPAALLGSASCARLLLACPNLLLPLLQAAQGSGAL